MKALVPLLIAHRRKMAWLAAGLGAAILALMFLAGAVVGVVVDLTRCQIPNRGLTHVAQVVATTRGRPVGFALVDEHGNVLADHNGDARHHGRSMSKALVLVALTRSARERPLTDRERQMAAAMIRRSDNAAANALVDLVGERRINRVARKAGMRSWRGETGKSAYRLGVAKVTAVDFARLFAGLDELIPRRHRAWALGLLERIEGQGRFGVLEANIPGRVLSKGGWMPNDPVGWTVTQAAQITIDGRRYGISVVLGRQRSFKAGGDAVARIMSAAYEALSAPIGGVNPGSWAARLPAGAPYTGPTFRTQATAYGPPWDSMNGTGVTKTGFRLPPGPVPEMIPIVAVDRSRVPLGSLVYIWPNPYDYAGPFHALDIGGAIKGDNAIDFLVMEGREAQAAWGRRQVTVSGAPLPEAAGGRAPVTDAVDCVVGDELSGAPNLPRSVTELQRRAVTAANQIQAMRLPYCWGGGHGPRPGPSYIVGNCWNARLDGRHHSSVGIDCSGAVRLLLVMMGYGDPGGIASGSFGSANYGTAEHPIRMRPGPGRWMTIYYNAEHIWVRILGRSWETSSSNYMRGPGWTNRTSAAGYNVGHLPGM